MKIVPYLGSAIILALSMTSEVLAGGLAGGGGPPSKQLLEHMLETQSGRAALFVWDEQTYGLGVDKSLVPAILLTTKAPSSESVALNSEDFHELAGKRHPVNAINRDGITRSYRVLDGVKNGTLLLIDRRVLIRAGVRP
jgi:hypothetical protein